VRMNQRASPPEEGESDGSAFKIIHYSNQSSGSVIMSHGSHCHSCLNQYGDVLTSYDIAVRSFRTRNWFRNRLCERVLTIVEQLVLSLDLLYIQMVRLTDNTWIIVIIWNNSRFLNNAKGAHASTAFTRRLSQSNCAL
jgi:hypothetical protein